MKKQLVVIMIIVGLLSSPYIGQAAKVVVDPGHGGSDPGAIGVNGLYEKNVNLDIARFLRDMLIEHGYEVVMTRSEDKPMPLQDRVELARGAGADLFVSVHANSHNSSSIRGTMVLYHDAAYPNKSYPASAEMTALTKESRTLAKYVLDSVLEQVPNTNRGLVPSSAYVVRMGNTPSVLVETAFLSNRQDAAMLASGEVRRKYAVGILNGIMKYLPAAAFSDIGLHWAKESIARLHELGVANGNNGRFAPDRPVTRAELMSLTERAFGFPAPKRTEVVTAAWEKDAGTVSEQVYGNPSPQPPGPPEWPSFPDLPSDHWAYDTMMQAVAAGVLRGYPDGSLQPDAPVTRAEVAAVLERLIGGSLTFMQTGGNLAFADVDESNWAYGPIMLLSRAGIVRGVEIGRFAPDRYVTRAEVAVMVDRQLSGGTFVVSAEPG